MALKSGIINTAVQFMNTTINYVTQLALAWWILPSEFGLLALTFSITAFLLVLREAGSSRVLIQRKDQFNQLVGSVFLITAATSVGISILMALGTPAIAWMYGKPELEPVLYWQIPRLLLGGFGIVTYARLVIDMQWKLLGYTQLASAIVSSVLALVMAKLGYGVYALIIPPLVNDLLRIALMRAVRPVHVPLRPSKTAIKAVLGASVFLIGSGLTFATRSQANTIVIGLGHTLAATGLYYFASTTANAAFRLLASGLYPVLFPVFATIGNDQARLGQAFERCFRATLVVLVPCAALQIVIAQPLFVSVISPRFSEAVPMFQWLTVAFAITTLNGVIVQPMQGKGWFERLFYFDLAFVFVEVAAIVIGVYAGGVLGVCIAYAISSLIGFTTFHAFGFRLLQIRGRDSILPIWRPLLACTAFVLPSLYLARFVSDSRPMNIALVIAMCMLAAIIYPLMIWLLWPAAWNDVLSMSRAGKRHPAEPATASAALAPTTPSPDEPAPRG